MFRRIKKEPLHAQGLTRNLRAAFAVEGLLDDYDFTSTLRGELNHAVFGGEQGVIFAETDVEPRVILRAALADDDVARFNDTAFGLFQSKTLSVGIAAVRAAALTFFMSEKL